MSHESDPPPPNPRFSSQDSNGNVGVPPREPPVQRGPGQGVPVPRRAGDGGRAARVRGGPQLGQPRPGGAPAPPAGAAGGHAPGAAARRLPDGEGPRRGADPGAGREQGAGGPGHPLQAAPGGGARPRKTLDCYDPALDAWNSITTVPYSLIPTAFVSTWKQLPA